jgi:hypothetical protein
MWISPTTSMISDFVDFLSFHVSLVALTSNETTMGCLYSGSGGRGDG